MAIPSKPSISALPPAPQRTDTPTDFSSKADTFIAALPTFRQQVADGIDWQNTVFTETEQQASAAAQSARQAAQNAQGVSQYAESAEQSATSAQAAASAAQSSAGLPALSGNAGLPLVVNDDETGVVYSGSLRRYDLASLYATAALDLAASQVFRVVASTARTLTFSNGPGVGRAMTVVVHISGNSAVTWPTGIDWDSDTAPELGDNETKVVLFWDGVEWSGFVRVAK